MNEKHTSKLGIKLFKLFQDICNIGTSFRIEVEYNNRNNNINVPNSILPPNSSVINVYILYITLQHSLDNIYKALKYFVWHICFYYFI